MSTKTPTNPLNTPHLDALRDQVSNIALALLSTIAIATLLVIAARQIYFFTRYRDPAVRRLAKRKAAVEYKANVKITEISPKGWIKMAPKDKEWWELLAKTRQLDDILKIPTRIKISNQLVQIATLIPNSTSIPGKMTYDPNTDLLTLGRNTQTKKKAHLQLETTSNIVVAGQPGTGKTTLLKGIMDAVRPNAHVLYFNGSAGDTTEIAKSLQQLEELKQQRLQDGIDYWREKNDNQHLAIFIFDEIQEYFQTKDKKNTPAPQTEIKIAKATKAMQNCHQVGIIVIIVTANPTPTTLPTPIRDQTNTQICANVSTTNQAAHVLGRKPTPLDPKPTNLPPGRVTISDNKGNWEQVDIYSPRFFQK